MCRQGTVGRPEEGNVENNGHEGAVRDCKSRRPGFVAKITPWREGGVSAHGASRDTETVFCRRHRFRVPTSRDREGAGRFVSPQSQSGQSFPRKGAMHLEKAGAGGNGCLFRSLTVTARVRRWVAEYGWKFPKITELPVHPLSTSQPPHQKNRSGDDFGKRLEHSVPLTVRTGNGGGIMSLKVHRKGVRC